MQAVKSFILTVLLLGPTFLSGCDSADRTRVSGTVRLAPDAVVKVGESDALFLTARLAGSEVGPPMAVVKLLGVRFPQSFALGQDDVLMPGSWFRGPVVIRAILRRSGFIDVASPGDLVGQTSAPVQAGESGVTIDLRRE
ncbi:MAG: hypothetical protein VKP62_09030 [Candidatus Sericytochromatia bacterium]|nr:hypothetical protein [Candidatus Sericytochromatia bacterium]